MDVRPAVKVLEPPSCLPDVGSTRCGDQKSELLRVLALTALLPRHLCWPHCSPIWTDLGGVRGGEQGGRTLPPPSFTVRSDFTSRTCSQECHPVTGTSREAPGHWGATERSVSLQAVPLLPGAALALRSRRVEAGAQHNQLLAQSKGCRCWSSAVESVPYLWPEHTAHCYWLVRKCAFWEAAERNGNWELRLLPLLNRFYRKRQISDLEMWRPRPSVAHSGDVQQAVITAPC